MTTIKTVYFSNELFLKNGLYSITRDEKGLREFNLNNNLFYYIFALLTVLLNSIVIVNYRDEIIHIKDNELVTPFGFFIINIIAMDIISSFTAILSMFNIHFINIVMIPYSILMNLYFICIDFPLFYYLGILFFKYVTLSIFSYMTMGVLIIFFYCYYNCNYRKEIKINTEV